MADVLKEDGGSIDLEDGSGGDVLLEDGVPGAPGFITRGRIEIDDLIFYRH